MNQNMQHFAIYEETFAKYTDIQNLNSYYIPLVKVVQTTDYKVHFGEILTKYTPRDKVARTNFRASSQNGNAVVVIISRFNKFVIGV